MRSSKLRGGLLAAVVLVGTAPFTFCRQPANPWRWINDIHAPGRTSKFYFTHSVRSVRGLMRVEKTEIDLVAVDGKEPARAAGLDHELGAYSKDEWGDKIDYNTREGSVDSPGNVELLVTLPSDPAWAGRKAKLVATMDVAYPAKKDDAFFDKSEVITSEQQLEISSVADAEKHDRDVREQDEAEDRYRRDYRRWESVSTLLWVISGALLLAFGATFVFGRRA